MEAKGQVVANTPIYYKDKEARDLLGEEELETTAQTCTGAINELKGTLDDLGDKMVCVLLSYSTTSNAFELPSGTPKPKQTSGGNRQVTFVVRNQNTGAIHVIWYHNTNNNFQVASTISGSAPANGNNAYIQYLTD